MKCTKCNAEISDSAQFCPVCGAKQEVQQAAGTRFCGSCGAALREGALFCAVCGQRCADGGPAAPPDAGESFPVQSKGKAGGKGPAPAIVIGALAACLVLAVVLKMTVLNPDRADKADSAGDSDAMASDDAAVSDDAGEVLEPDGNDPAVQEPEPDVPAPAPEPQDTGFPSYSVCVASSDRLGVNFREGPDSSYRKLRENPIPDGTILTVINEATSVKGSQWGYISYEGKEGWIYLAEVVRLEDQAPAEPQEILPDSATRLLTQDDLNGLTLQQINYAKNEIYARHGRKFNSKELQDYFNSKDWYSGTIEPGQFKESMLSSTERKNADFLAKVEFSISPNGYKLDA